MSTVENVKEVKSMFVGIREFQIYGKDYRIERNGPTCTVRELRDGAWVHLGVTRLDFDSKNLANELNDWLERLE